MNNNSNPPPLPPPLPRELTEKEKKFLRFAVSIKTRRFMNALRILDERFGTTVSCRLWFFDIINCLKYNQKISDDAITDFVLTVLKIRFNKEKNS